MPQDANWKWKYYHWGGCHGGQWGGSPSWQSQTGRVWDIVSHHARYFVFLWDSEKNTYLYSIRRLETTTDGVAAAGARLDQELSNVSEGVEFPLPRKDVTVDHL